ncbi:conserved hypothetical protein [Vibrio coralliirubri]|nr:conserved hypothetical protein [Vibrio coralliirubri]
MEQHMQTNDNLWFDKIDCIRDKALVELVNGLDVSRDHQNCFDSQSYSSRLLSGLTGKNQARQGEINKALTEGLESTLSWLTALTDSEAYSNLAIQQVNQRVDKLTEHLTHLAGDYMETRSKLEALAAVTSDRLTVLENDIANLKLEVKAKTQLDLVFSRWSAGYWHGFPIATRCYIALEELRWGSFGDFIRSVNDKERSDYLELLRNKVIEQLAVDSGSAVKERIDSQTWIEHSAEKTREAVEFLGDWCLEYKHPATFFVTQDWEKAPLYMPRIISATKLGNYLTEEVFGQEDA